MTLTLNQMQNQLIQINSLFFMAISVTRRKLGFGRITSIGCMEPIKAPRQLIPKQFLMHEKDLRLLRQPLNKPTRTLMEMLMKMRIPKPAAWKPSMGIKQSRTPEIKT